MFYPSVMASVVMALFGIRHMFVLPFSGHVRVGHYETVMTRLSYYIYSMEDFSFPYGVIKGLAAPFHDANIGNLGDSTETRPSTSGIYNSKDRQTNPVIINFNYNF